MRQTSADSGRRKRRSAPARRYADARVACVVRRAQTVATKNGQVETISDADSEGIGVRVLVDGAWGFACDRRHDAGGAREAALRATAFAKAAPGGHRALARAGRGARGGVPDAARARPVRGLARGQGRALPEGRGSDAHADVIVRSASVRAQREHKMFVSSTGARSSRSSSRRAAGSTRSRRPRGSSSSAATRARTAARAPGRLGVRRRPRPRAGGAARRRAGERAPARRRVPGPDDDGRPRRRSR